MSYVGRDFDEQREVEELVHDTHDLGEIALIAKYKTYETFAPMTMSEIHQELANAPGDMRTIPRKNVTKHVSKDHDSSLSRRAKSYGRQERCSAPEMQTTRSVNATWSCASALRRNTATEARSALRSMTTVSHQYVPRR